MLVKTALTGNPVTQHVSSQLAEVGMDKKKEPCPELCWPVTVTETSA